MTHEESAELLLFLLMTPEDSCEGASSTHVEPSKEKAITPSAQHVIASHRGSLLANHSKPHSTPAAAESTPDVATPTVARGIVRRARRVAGGVRRALGKFP